MEQKPERDSNSRIDWPCDMLSVRVAFFFCMLVIYAVFGELLTILAAEGKRG